MSQESETLPSNTESITEPKEDPKTIKNEEEKEEEKKIINENNDSEEDDDDEDENPTDEWIPYHKRPEWKDVTPIDLPNVTEYPTLAPPLCPLSKNDYITEIQCYMRAMLNADERSERALGLTKDAIRINNSDFIAWYYRRSILFALDRADLFHAELDFVEAVATNSPKNYQLYYHREAVVSYLQKHSASPEAFAKLVDKEFNWCTSVTCADSKNYHAWSYRKWLVASFPEASDVGKERRYIDFALKLDPHNNSAWNYRYFIMFKIGGEEEASQQKQQQEENVVKDLEFVVEKIGRSPNNAAPWCYLNALLELEVARKSADFMDRVMRFAEEACEKYPVCRHCVVLLSDLLKGDESRVDQRVALLEKLRDSIDTTRAKYWDSLINEIPKRT